MGSKLQKTTNHVQKPEAVAMQVKQFAGPLPPPEVLAGYDQICPGAAERIIKTYEIEVSHRHEMERAMVASDISVQRSIPRQIRLGQVFAFIICISFLVCGTFLIYNDHDWPGAFFGGGGLIGIVSAFLYSSKHETNSDQE